MKFKMLFLCACVAFAGFVFANSTGLKKPLGIAVRKVPEAGTVCEASFFYECTTKPDLNYQAKRAFKVKFDSLEALTSPDCISYSEFCAEKSRAQFFKYLTNSIMAFCYSCNKNAQFLISFEFIKEQKTVVVLCDLAKKEGKICAIVTILGIDEDCYPLFFSLLKGAICGNDPDSFYTKYWEAIWLVVGISLSKIIFHGSGFFGPKVQSDPAKSNSAASSSGGHLDPSVDGIGSDVLVPHDASLEASADLSLRPLRRGGDIAEDPLIAPLSELSSVTSSLALEVAVGFLSNLTRGQKTWLKIKCYNPVSNQFEFHGAKNIADFLVLAPGLIPDFVPLQGGAAIPFDAVMVGRKFLSQIFRKPVHSVVFLNFRDLFVEEEGETLSQILIKSARDRVDAPGVLAACKIFIVCAAGEVMEPNSQLKNFYGDRVQFLPYQEDVDLMANEAFRLIL